jgi:hypothetical protein
LDVTTSHNKGTLLFWLQSRPFTLAAHVLEGAQDRRYEWIKGPISPPDFGSKRKVDWTSLPATTEELCCFGYNHDLSRSLLGRWRAPKIAATSGSRMRSHNRTLRASGRKIGRHYQPQQRNFVVLVTITTFYARCSRARGRPRSQLPVDQECDLTSGLWEQAEGRLDVTASHNRGTLFFWLQSRPFTLAAPVLEGAQDRSYERIKGHISPLGY